VYWTARAYKAVSKKNRFINPTGKDGYYGKSDVLYCPRIPSNNRSCIIVEGQFDAIRLISLGINAVCTYNANPSKRQIRDIVKRFKSVTIAYDNDEAGLFGVYKLGTALKSFGISIYYMVVESADDAGDYNRKEDFLKDFSKRINFTDNF